MMRFVGFSSHGSTLALLACVVLLLIPIYHQAHLSLSVVFESGEDVVDKKLALQQENSRLRSAIADVGKGWRRQEQENAKLRDALLLTRTGFLDPAVVLESAELTGAASTTGGVSRADLLNQYDACRGMDSNIIHEAEEPTSLTAAITTARLYGSVYQGFKVREFFFVGRDQPEFEDVTVVTQLSYDRLSRLDALALRWQGPISAAIYIKNIDRDLRAIMRMRQSSAFIAKHVDFHLMFEPTQKTPPPYPVNHLRNLAATRSRTAWVFLLDVDLIPDPGARTSILKHFENARSKGDPAALKNKVFVAPAFEMLSNASEIPPRNKDELISLIKQGHASPVHFSRFSPAHRATNYDRWYAANSSYMIDFELLYEPYVVVRLPMPLYDTRFIGYGHDKASHLYEMEAAGFKFEVLAEPFLVHMEHASPKWRGEQNLKAVWINWWKFVLWIQITYKYVMPVPDWLDITFYHEWFDLPGAWVIFTTKDDKTIWFNKKTETSYYTAPPAIKDHPDNPVLHFHFISTTMDDINTINEGSGQKSPASASGQKGKKAHGEGSGTHRLIYDKLDKDNNGIVNYEELDTGLAKTFGLSVNSEEMKILHTQFDKNNDGIISWAEFDTVLVKAEGLLPH